MNLSSKDQKEIIQAIDRVETGTSAEIRVHLDRRCGQDVLKKARQVFQKLGMHKTKLRNGVLIYVAWDSHCFAVIGDQGIHEKVGDAFWKEVIEALSLAFKKGAFKEGLIQALEMTGKKLAQHFPAGNQNKNELSNTISME